MAQTLDPTETYLHNLLAGNTAALLAGFAGDPDVDDPLGGHVQGRADFERFAAERRAWLVERQARIEPLRTTRAGSRTVFEALVHLRLPTGEWALPVGVVGEAATSAVSVLRVYHSLWPLNGKHSLRRAILPVDHSVQITGVVAEYQHALATGNVEAIVNTFEADGYFREPAGGEYFYQGRERLHHIMHMLLAPGGIPLEHCTVTDDGVACAIEFNAVRFGKLDLVPQAGVAVYERGASGRLCGARIYDDVNVEAYASQSGQAGN